MKKSLFAVPLLLVSFACSKPAEEPVVSSEPPPASAEATNTAQADTATLDQTASEPVTESGAEGAPAEQTQETMAAKAVKGEINMDNPADLVAEMKTGQGTIVIGFYPQAAPNHVRNFLELSQSGFYDGTKFHRVIPGFMIQGGDPNTKGSDPGTWGIGGSGTNLKAEFNDIPHKRGILSMARSGHPDSASSQFFIVVKDAPSLDHQYTVFGVVLQGMDVADKIVSAPRGAQDRPNDPVAIEAMTIRPATAEEKSKLAK